MSGLQLVEPDHCNRIKSRLLSRRVPPGTLGSVAFPGAHHPSWQCLEAQAAHCCVSPAPGTPLMPLCSPEPVGCTSSALPTAGSWSWDSATVKDLSSRVSVSSHPGSRVYSTFETFWELLASNCDVSLECPVAGEQGEETCCCTTSERFTISSRAPGWWVWMWRARLPVSEAQGRVVLLFITH